MSTLQKSIKEIISKRYHDNPLLPFYIQLKDTLKKKNKNTISNKQHDLQNPSQHLHGTPTT
jgi:hypothetical protein